MIARIIEFSVRNRFLVLLGTAAVALWGVYCLFRTPIDAIPDLSENQAIVWADWPGRSPREVEDQITYPLSVNLQGLTGVKSIRATSEFGFSMVIVIFEEQIDYYFARQRVMERLSIAGSFLPSGVVPYLAPDATAVGQIFWYTVEGEGKSLDELRSIQDWYVRYQLNAVPGVTQVASAGGFVREYQIDVDPAKLRAFDLSLGQVFDAVMRSNSSVGGKVIHKGGAEYLVRATGWLRGIEDLRRVVVAERRGVPITVERLGAVQLGPAFRRGVLEKNGSEAVGGVVMMRHGENPLEVTERIKEKIGQLQAGLPAGVSVVPFYDRTGLIHASIATLTGTLVEEILVASLVVFLVLWHLRSAFVICITLPLAVLIAFIFMHYLKIPSNIMSLSGIAISIGVLVDAGIVMTENAYNRLHEHFRGERVAGDTRGLVIDACKVVGRPLFFSILIMLISFAPVFVLGGLEGKMFNPLAYTKSFALAGVAVLAITLVPALIPTFVRGKLKSQEEVWLVRSFVNVYKPLLEFFLKHPDFIVVITGTFLLLGIPIFPRKVPWIFFVVGVPFLVGISAMLVARRKVACLAILFFVAVGGFRLFQPLGEEFMPPLDEQSLMDMPITTPNVNITQASEDLKARNAVLRQFPEVHQVVGKLGRAETPTDPAPIDMVETVVTLRPKTVWPKRKVEYADARSVAAEAVRALEARGLLKPVATDERASFENDLTMAALAGLDRSLRDLASQRLREFAPERARALVRLLRTELMGFLSQKGVVQAELPPARWSEIEERIATRFGPRFDEWILTEDVAAAVREIVDFLAAERVVQPAGDLLVRRPSPLGRFAAAAFALVGRKESALFERFQAVLAARDGKLRVERMQQLNREIEDRAPRLLIEISIAEALSRGREKEVPVRDSSSAAMTEAAEAVAKSDAAGFFLWPKEKQDLKEEMKSELQVPGWSNIFTQPIINRVDMLSTGVRTMVGVKIFGSRIEDAAAEQPAGGASGRQFAEKGLQTISNEVAEVLKSLHGAVDVFPDQATGENYLEIDIDRERAARYGVDVQDIQDVIEVALGGKDITMTVEGRQRFPVRVRYPRDLRADEEMVKTILIPAGRSGGMDTQAGAGAAEGSETLRLRQVPLSQVATIRITTGPSMIKSEDGRLRTYVYLNVEGRDIVGFVEEAQRVVEATVKLPPGFSIEWTGQFEHQVRAQKTLTLIFPLVIFLIFTILYLTYRDLPDTLLMFLSVPGAVAGGALFQYLFGHQFSVAVWVGYIACFGLATETGIVMLIYLREALEKRGGIEKIRSEDEIREAVIEGAVHRLRPKLLTEGTTILALIPMLWATGVGAEYMRPMAAPILGGILVADEVIDIFIPVLFYWDRCRRLKKFKAKEAARTAG